MEGLLAGTRAHHLRQERGHAAAAAAAQPHAHKPPRTSAPRETTQGKQAVEGQGARTLPAAQGQASLDPVSAFFDGETVLPPPMAHPGAAPDIDKEVAAAIAEPLCFPNATTEVVLSSQAYCAPAPASSVGMQLGAVTQRVQQMAIQDQDAAPTPHNLFAEVPAPLLPPPRSSAPLKMRTASAPACQSARQASNPSTVPVAHRATLRLVRDLGLLGPKDKMTPKAAKALFKKLDEPLTEEDIEGLAKLTNQDPLALRIAAGLVGPDGAPRGEDV